MPDNYAITPDVVEAYNLCHRKAFLLLRADRGDAPHEYVRILNGRAVSALDTFVGTLQASGLTIERHPNPKLVGNPDVLAQALLKTDHHEAVADVLVRLDPRTSKVRHYEPH